MKKILSLLLIFSMILSLQACSKNEDSEKVDDDKKVVAEVDEDKDKDQDEDQDKDPVVNEDENNEEITSESQDDENINGDLAISNNEDIYKDLFDRIVNFPMGTAGSSLKSQQLASSFLNELAKEDNIDNFINVLDGYLKNLSDDEKEIFKANYENLSYDIKGLAERNEEALNQLSDSGANLNSDALESEDWMPIDQKIKDLLGL